LATRAGSRVRSHSIAGASKPSSWRRASRTPSSPERWVWGARCCQCRSGRDRFDLFAEGGDGAAVDALQDAAFAPFDVVVGVPLGWRVFEDAAQEESLHLHGEESLENCARVEV
jgi:hypothetical protein